MHVKKSCLTASPQNKTEYSQLISNKKNISKTSRKSSINKATRTQYSISNGVSRKYRTEYSFCGMQILCQKCTSIIRNIQTYATKHQGNVE